MTTDDPIIQLSELTERQREILRLRCRGMKYSSIGETLFITEETVKSHMANIYERLGLIELPPTERLMRLIDLYCSELQKMGFTPKPGETTEPEDVPKGLIVIVENDEKAIIPYPSEKERSKQKKKEEEKKRERPPIILGIILGIGIIGVILYALWRSGFITIGPPPTEVSELPPEEQVIDDEAKPEEIQPSPTSESQEEVVVPTSTFPPPTDTQKPTDIPTSTPIPNTQKGTILKVGETWIQDGVHLTLRDVEMRSEGDGRVFLTFDVGNFTGSDLLVSFYAGDLSIVSNTGERFEPHGGPNSYSVDTATWNEVLENGERKDVWFWHTRRPSWDGNIFAPGFSHLTITVRNWDPINEAVWETK